MTDDLLDVPEQKFLLLTARQVIEARLQNQTYVIPETELGKPVFFEKRGVFVTLKKRGQLRGCIGYPLPYKGLLDAVVDNAAAAAFQDPRFPPVKVPELSDICIEISVLTVPRTVQNPLDVRVGHDGIIVTDGFKRGLLLPQVPLEEGWELETYLNYGCIKAGLPADHWRTGRPKIEVFSAQVFGEEGKSTSS